VRVLVVGPVPPPPEPTSDALADVVARLVADGNEVEVVYDDPRSAAHHHIRLVGVPGCLRLASMAGRFDALVLQLEPSHLIRAHSGRLERACTLAVLAAATRRFREVTLRIGYLSAVPGGIGGRAARGLFARANSVVVRSDEQRDEIHRDGGVPLERIEVEPITIEYADREPEGWGVADGDVSREAVLTVVRRRATTDRRRAAGLTGVVVAESFAGWEPSRAHRRIGEGPSQTAKRRTIAGGFGASARVARRVLSRLGRAA
jgi:hypothetical protein